MTERALRVALVGSPNTGKTTLFNALTGMRAKIVGSITCTPMNRPDPFSPARSIRSVIRRTSP